MSDPTDTPQPGVPEAPDYLIAMHVALNDLRVAKDNGAVDLRYASIAITDLEKLIAFTSLYLVDLK